MKDTKLSSFSPSAIVCNEQIEGKIYHNLQPAELVEHALELKEGLLTDTGALMVDTGKFTGRSPEDKFFVIDAISEPEIWWNESNKGIEQKYYTALKERFIQNLNGKRLYIQDVKVGADASCELKVRVVTTYAYCALFAHNMFLQPKAVELEHFKPDYVVLADPDFTAYPAVDHTRKENFTIVALEDKCILIGGSGYTGEIKKSVFTVMNILLPLKHKIFPMHCSANESENGETAIFFGLSGTGKTTLSADPKRKLIGDDEHGWSDTGIFNFEGGCYAKTINIKPETEPQIYSAIKFGALLENTRFFPATRKVNYADCSVTENTRVSYPLEHIPGAKIPSVGAAPKHIFFLTCDANGVLPPVSRLDKPQAMFHFISGYTAKVAGTEMGITEPKLTFSTCFGAPFMGLHPARYAEMLGRKMDETQAKVWLINTGWVGGAFGVGSRIKLAYTRAIIDAIFSGEIERDGFVFEPIFGLHMPVSCPNVPSELLNPRNAWSDPYDYDLKRDYLAIRFLENFEKFESFASDEIKSGAPKPAAKLSV
jgi:phosphoenolpyruvate carboxykinase (ATP)